MAIEYVGGQTQALSASGSTTVTFALTGGLASAPADGDMVLVSVALTNTSDVSIGVLTTGYSEIAELYSNDTDADANLSLSWKRMGASPDASVQVSGTGSAGVPGIVWFRAFGGGTTQPDLMSRPQQIRE